MKNRLDKVVWLTTYLIWGILGSTMLLILSIAVKNIIEIIS